MRRWGLLVSLFYAAIVIGLLWPSIMVLAGHSSWRDAYADAYTDRGFVELLWVWGVLLVGGQALLLTVSVDVSRRKLRPRQHVAASAAAVGAAVTLLGVAAVWSLIAGVFGDSPPDVIDAVLEPLDVFWAWLLVWLFWSVVFYAYYRSTPARLTRAVSWLLKGSVLELLIAVPAHVVARRREDCSAPVVTGFGIATGIAIMLMCFGPGVVALYRKRLDRYQ